MTEEKYIITKNLKEEISKMEFKLSTIDNLMDSVELKMEIKGISTCHFRINRFIELNGDDYIKSILDGERKTMEYHLSKLKDEFNKL